MNESFVYLNEGLSKLKWGPIFLKGSWNPERNSHTSNGDSNFIYVIINHNSRESGAVYFIPFLWFANKQVAKPKSVVAASRGWLFYIICCKSKYFYGKKRIAKIPLPLFFLCLIQINIILKTHIHGEGEWKNLLPTFFYVWYQ